MGERRAHLTSASCAPKSTRRAAVSKDDFLDCVHNRARAADARSWHLEHAGGDLAYARWARRNGGGVWLQYWFFYYFNDFEFAGVGVHEADWEMIQIGIADDHKTADVATFAQHREGQALAWADVELDEDRPVVYVALGSHASYPSMGEHDGAVVRDTCDGRGKRQPVRLEIIDGQSPSRVQWPGRWGASRERWPKWFNSPRGPASRRRSGTTPTGSMRKSKRVGHVGGTSMSCSGRCRHRTRSP